MGKRIYDVRVSRKALRSAHEMPEHMLKRFWRLTNDLAEKGPMLPGWPNFSKLGPEKYHCHLGYSWVACWSHDKSTIEIEVYYAGHRKNAPY
jgi:hypothetical protein